MGAMRLLKPVPDLASSRAGTTESQFPMVRYGKSRERDEHFGIDVLVPLALVIRPVGPLVVVIGIVDEALWPGPAPQLGDGPIVPMHGKRRACGIGKDAE